MLSLARQEPMGQKVKVSQKSPPTQLPYPPTQTNFRDLFIMQKGGMLENLGVLYPVLIAWEF